ncbi:hypothetical protein ACIP9G_11145 [Lysinibacillus sp. NPDC093197]|uniref:hypothetical protein n=1 Tax=Lysinibacillus sp. NPDC093197 TaxID=3364132 RepID=UPI003828B64E
MKKILPLLFGMLILLVGCSNKEKEYNVYTGKDLKIGVIGTIPAIREENIIFQKTTFEDLKNKTEYLSKELDAIMIMKEFLSEAADDQYVLSYKTLKVPIFFMQSTKAHVPFVNEGVQYDDVIDIQPSSYATGFLYLGTDQEYKDNTWRYELKKKRVFKMYFRVFFLQLNLLSF